MKLPHFVPGSRLVDAGTVDLTHGALSPGSGLSAVGRSDDIALLSAQLKQCNSIVKASGTRERAPHVRRSPGTQWRNWNRGNGRNMATCD